MNSKTLRQVKKLAGDISVPGDKSISHRAIMIGAIANGRTEVRGILDCDDCNFTMDAFRKMGVSINKSGEMTYIDGKGLKGLARPKDPIYVGNSGTTMRILPGLLAGQDFDVQLICDKGLSRRPMGRVVEPLALMGADILSAPGGVPPLAIRGCKLRPISYRMSVASAQVKSAILFAGLFAEGTTEIEELIKTRDHTERMLKHFGAELRVDRLKVRIKGSHGLSAQKLAVPGDPSSASFFMVAASLVDGSKLKIRNVNTNPTRAGIIGIMKRMGAKLTVSEAGEGFEPVSDIVVESSSTRGVVIEPADIPAIIDELPVIFVLASLSRGRTVIKGAGELKVKETDRIASMSENLRAMGADISIEGDDIVIEGVDRLNGASLKSYGDHRTCMSIAVASLAARGESRIDDIACVSKSFPEFFGTLDRVSI